MGLSRNKAAFLHDLAAATSDGRVSLTKIGRKDDEAIIAELIQVKGVGRWTAQMFLMFSLGRPDVLPVGDLGIRAAMRNLYGLAELPNETVAHEIGAQWRKHASNDIANRGGFLDRLIPRERLKPRRGTGWRSTLGLAEARLGILRLKEFVMEGVRSSRRVPGMLAPAGVLRQFDGSRIERQVLAQAFELVWRVEREGMNGIPSMTPGEERLAAKRVTQVAAPRVSSQRHVDAAGGAAGGP